MASPRKKDAVLLIDRGSREEAVQGELRTLSGLVRSLGGFDIGEHALLEVRGPTIEEGLANCAKAGAERVVAYPYFLHNGMKCQAAVGKVRALSSRSPLEVVPVETPLGVDQALIDLVISRARELKASRRPAVEDEECQLLLVGHGSSYPQEREDFHRIARIVREQSRYGGVGFCFLELAGPTIAEGIRGCLDKRPKLVLMVPYFLHYGAHLQRDIPQELQAISREVDLSNVLFGRHLGADPKLAELVVKRIREGSGAGRVGAPDSNGPATS